MPVPLLAHQAPILPLKLRWPGAWNGTALVLGSIAPDVEYLRMAPFQEGSNSFGHTLLAQAILWLPLTFLVVLAIGRLRLGEVLVARLGPRFAWLSRAATDVNVPGGLRRAALSALVGSLSHIGLDAVTHSGLFARLHVPTVLIAGVHFGPTAIAQLVASAVFALVSLWLLLLIARGSTLVCPERKPGVGLILVLALVGAVLGARRAIPALLRPDLYFDAGPVYVWGLIVFFAACGAGAGSLLAGVVLWARDRGSAAAP